jgi:endonuclease/exonuclease/phosphatase (EEP) superfamily protein YafD
MIGFLTDDLSTLLDLAALAAIFGAFLAYTRVRAALVASEAAGKAWHEERDAEKARSERISYDLKMSEDEKVKLLATVAALEQRPDLSRLESLVAESTESMKRHELSAADRTERLIAAVESIRPQAA